jgi:hypothetical protein
MHDTPFGVYRVRIRSARDGFTKRLFDRVR